MYVSGTFQGDTKQRLVAKIRIAVTAKDYKLKVNREGYKHSVDF